MVKAKTKNPKAQPAVAKKPRKRAEPKYRSFKLTKKIKPTKPLPGFFALLAKSLKIITTNKRLFSGIIIINTLLGLIFVAGLSSSSDFVQIKQNVEELLSENTGRAGTTLALFGYLITSAGAQSGEVAGTYQIFLNLITSLAVIWAVRQVMANESVSAKQAYYMGLYPLVPVILVLLVIGLQLLPALIGTALYSIVLSTGIAVTAIEQVVWLLLFIMFCLLSLYFITSSTFAVYIITLPEMTPLRALRSARGLVLHRRLAIMLRIVAFFILLALAVLLLVAPVILLVPWLAIVWFLLLSSFALCLIHSYLYNLYRSLL